MIMSNLIELNSLNTPIQLKHFIESYHSKANELYGLQIPKIGKSKNIFSKAMGLNSWSSYESLVTPDALEKITLGEVISVGLLSRSMDSFRDCLSPSVRLVDRYWHFDSVTPPILNKNISGVNYGTSLFIDYQINCLVFSLKIDNAEMPGYVFTADATLFSIRDKLHELAKEDGIEFISRIADDFDYAYCQLPILMYVYGSSAFGSSSYSSEVSRYLNEPDLDKKQNILKGIPSILANDVSINEIAPNNIFDYISRMQSSFVILAAHLSTPIGMYRVAVKYQSMIERELSLGHLSNQKVAAVLEAVSDFSYQGVCDFPLFSYDGIDLEYHHIPERSIKDAVINITGKAYTIELGCHTLCSTISYFTLCLVEIDGVEDSRTPVVNEMFVRKGDAMDLNVLARFIEVFISNLVNRKSINHAEFTEDYFQAVAWRLNTLFGDMIDEPRGVNSSIFIKERPNKG
jgi:hypothetical protein